MKQVLPGFAKRALAFMLAFVLLLGLIPLNAKAEEVVGNWTYMDSYSWINGSFETSDADLVYKGADAYDWRVYVLPTKSPPASAQVVASITDASGKIISSYSGNVYGMAQREETTLCSYSDFPELTTSLAGTFTLTCELKLSDTTYAKLVQTFSRKSDSQFTTTVTSRSNPDNVFTFADPIDLVLNIKKDNGVAEAYNAAVTVTNASETEVLAARGVPLPESQNITLSVKDLVKLPEITEAGTYKLNLTLTDSTGTIQYQSSFDFAVVDLINNLTATVTSASDFVFNNTVPDLVINLQKNDGIAETLITAVTVTDSTGNSYETVPYTTSSANATVTPDLSSLPNPGNYTLTATITDDAGNHRATVSPVSFTRVVPITCRVSDANTDNTGNIYSASDDYKVNLEITHAANKGKAVHVKVVGTLNGKAYESNTKNATLSSTDGKVTVTIDGSMLGAYGIFEDLCIVVSDASGNELWRSTNEQTFTRSFARVLDTSTPGDLPLLNINDHFTSGKGDATLKIPLAAQTGANMWRSTIPWATVEKSKGNYAMGADVKTVMDQTKGTGMQALVILAYGNDEIYGTPNPTNSTWLNAYANYCYFVAEQMAKYYPDQVVAFEIWNEWNHSTMSKVPATYRTGAHYATVVKAASAKIRAVNTKYGTNFKVIAGATAGDGYGESSSNTFINAMFNATGFFAAVDGVSFHTYSSEETTDWFDQLKGQRVFEYISPAEHDFAARISNYKTMLSNANAPSDLEIWLTETGWTTNEVAASEEGHDGKTHITYGATEEDAAAYLVQLYAWALYDSTLDRIFWYDFMNDISNQTKIWANNQTESNYGLIHNWNNSDDQPLRYSAKAGYVTMCALASKLGGATNGKQISINNDKNIFAYQFSKDGKYITVIWAEGAAKTVNLTLNKSISVSDMYGNATTYSAGKITLTLTGAPIYLEYSSGAVSFG